MFNSPISKTQQELVQAARAATSDYITNGTDLTEAVVKAASAITPLTSEHVRRICEMTYHDAYERLFAEKTGSHQYVSFDPPDAIRASEILDALQLGVNQQHNFNKLASRKPTMNPGSVRTRLYSHFIKEAMTSEQVKAKNRELGQAISKVSQALKNDPGNTALQKQKEDLIAQQRALPNVRDLRAKEQQAAAAGGAEQKGADNTKNEKTVQKMKEEAKPKDAPDIDKNTVKNVDEVADEAADAAKKSTGFFGGMSGRNKMLLGGAGVLGLGALGYGAYRAGQKNAPQQPMQKAASSYSMPRKFQRMNTHELWTKAASGTEIPDSNPTRELQQVHRDLKDSISTVKSELYAAEHNEKLAMIDMVKQAKAGLSAGHSMEQVLHAALSVVDASEPFMAKTAHDLCATIIEACADHQNSGFRKEAEFRLMSLGEGIERARENSKGWKKNPMKLIYNFDHAKKASTPQEVNPNHPIPQKFKKLAEANIQRKHLEVTLDELNRNMDYFNEKLKDELTR